jgi:hypothetical protein
MQWSFWIQETIRDNIPTILNSRYFGNTPFFQLLLFFLIYRVPKSWYMDGFSLLRYLSSCNMWFTNLKLNQITFDEWWCKTCAIPLRLSYLPWKPTTVVLFENWWLCRKDLNTSRWFYNVSKKSCIKMICHSRIIYIAFHMCKPLELMPSTINCMWK